MGNEINTGKHGWTAGVPGKFETTEHVKQFLGAFLPGDAQYSEPDVLDVASNTAVPSSFDSVENWPQCTVIANVRDQSSCGSCWAFGSTSSFESRACIATGKDVKYSVEDTAFCSDAGDGCEGGNSAWDYFQSSGVVTGGDYTDIGSGDTCYPYSLAPCAHHVPATAEYPACPDGEYPSPRCKSSCTESGYSKSFSADKVHADSAYSVRGEQQIMQELTENGPLYVAFTVYGDFPTYRSGVYKHTSGSYLGGHAVTLVGYGELNGEKYWKIKNSWNEQWGDNGHFLITRGTNECGIEDSVSAGKISSKPSPSPTPSPSPAPTPAPTPTPPTPTPTPHTGDCTSEAIGDQATCESTLDLVSGNSCSWCYLSGLQIGFCVKPGDTQGCNGDVVV